MLSPIFEYLFPHLMDDITRDDTTINDDDTITTTMTDDEEDAHHLVQFAIHNSPLATLCGKTTAQDIDEMLLTATNDSAINSLIMGHVQSGKSRAMFGLALYLAIRHRHHIVVLLRDFICDASQFQINFENFLQEAIDNSQSHLPDSRFQEIKDLFPILYAGDLKEFNGEDDAFTKGNRTFIESFHDDRGSVSICLCNTIQIRRLSNLLEWTNAKSPLTLFIDEVDDLLYTEGYQLGTQLARFHEHFSSVYGISATVFDPIHDERFLGSRIMLLPPPSDYKGVDSIIFQTIGPLVNPKKPTPPIGQDPHLTHLLDSLRTVEISSNGSRHPMIMLLKNERLIKNQDELMRSIRAKYNNDFTIIVFNGRDAVVYSSSIPILSKYFLPTSHRKGTLKNKNTLVFHKADIQDVLQFVKNNGGASKHPRILIISHNMIGRGINIVSRDFGWHLTHMFYRPSSTAKLPHLLQSMRLCGRYKDNIPLYLYAEEKIISDIQRGNRLQSELVERIVKKSELNPEKTATDILRNEAVNPLKIPSRNIFLRKKKNDYVFEKNAEKDDGLTMKEFEKNMCIIKKPLPVNTDASNTIQMDEKEFYRLTNDKNGMFKKWADVSNQSAIARFMRDALDPRKEYTKKEMTDLCKEFGIEFRHIMNTNMGKKESHYGKIIVRYNKNYKLYSKLIVAFEKYF